MAISVEFAENPEPRCPVVLLLDTSGSMYGNPIAQLNAGVATFKQEVLKDTTAALRVEVAVITFDDSAKLRQNFVTVDEFKPPTLEAGGLTTMGQGIQMALRHVESRKAEYKNSGVSYYRPWILMISDGVPTDLDVLEQSAQQLKKAAQDKKVVMFPIGVEGFDLSVLQQVVPPPPSPQPVMLNGLKFVELFRWLSDSMKQISGSKVGGGMVNLPPTNGWASVDT